MAATQLQSVSKPWHEALTEYFILYPERTMTEAARHFGVSLAWLSQVKNSDAFQDYYQARRREHFNELSKSLADSKIEDKLRAVADMSLEAIADRVAEHVTKVPTRELSIDALQATANLALKSLGFMDKRGLPAAPLVQNNTIIVGQDALARAKGNLRVVRERLIDPVLEAAQQEKEKLLTHDESIESPKLNGDEALSAA